MPIYDVKCNKCNLVYEVLEKYDSPPRKCKGCGTAFVLRLPSFPNFARQHDPYDALDRSIPGKPIKSFGNDRRKGGKDTT